MRARVALALALLAACAAAAPAHAQTKAVAPDTLYVVDGYYPERDPEADLQLAVSRARIMDRRILLVVGGGWCVWCHILDRYLASDAVAHDAMAASFVILKVNMSRENQNARFLARYRESPGYPDFIVLDADGGFLAAQDTGELEEGDSYSRERMVAFAQRWRPH